MKRLRYTALFFLVLGVLAGARYFDAVAEDKSKMLSDVTIYLEPPILGGGGTVIVLPKEVPVEEWRRSTELENPALKDRRLDDMVPVKEGDRRLGAVVSDPISIVQFDYPEEGTFRFRFSPFLGSDYPMERLGTMILSFGSAGDLHPKTGDDVDIPKIQIVYILGKEITEGQARIAGETTRVGFLKERYNCREFEMVLACGASRDRLND